MMTLIDRDELIAKIRDDGILGNGYSDSEREDDVIDMIESCQTVDAKLVVRGEWEANCTCSRCGYCRQMTRSGNYMVGNFCPNCGADMRGDTDG